MAGTVVRQTQCSVTGWQRREQPLLRKGREHHLSLTRSNLHLMQVMGVRILAGGDTSEHFGVKVPSVLNMKHIITEAIKK